MWPSDALWLHRFRVNIGPGKGSLPEGAKQLPEAMLIHHQGSPMAIIQRQFHTKYLITYLIFISNPPAASKLIKENLISPSSTQNYHCIWNILRWMIKRLDIPMNRWSSKAMGIQGMCSLITYPNILFACVIFVSVCQIEKNNQIPWTN